VSQQTEQSTAPIQPASLSPADLGPEISAALNERVGTFWRELRAQTEMCRFADLLRGPMTDVATVIDFCEILALAARYATSSRLRSPEQPTQLHSPEELDRRLNAAYALLDRRLGSTWRSHESEMTRLRSVALANGRSPEEIADHLELLFLGARYGSFSRMAHPAGAVTQ